MSVAITILVLFPLMLLIDVRLAVMSMVVAVVILYRRRTATRRRRKLAKPGIAHASWRDPWNTDGLQS